MFTDRKLVIATKHSKETVIAPVLESGCGVKCIVPDDFDTDQLGTFSGEIERQDDPLKLLVKNAYWPSNELTVIWLLQVKAHLVPIPQSYSFLPMMNSCFLSIKKIICKYGSERSVQIPISAERKLNQYTS